MSSTPTLKAIEDVPEAAEFSDVFWLLNETEHGSESGERLHGFAELLNHESRSPELDASLLGPWLAQYVWEVPHSRYTAQAWRTLVLLTPEMESLAQLAEELLRHHPHGIGTP